MVLECCMLLIDNSLFALNGDYLPTRLMAQREAIIEILNGKINNNPESMVGLMQMASINGGVDMLVTPTREVGDLMKGLHHVNPVGKSKFVNALKTAALCLGHRLNKHQEQRIVMFVGSPIENEEGKVMARVGKELKKLNVNVDIINFGTENSSNSNTDILEEFLNAINRDDSSHLIQIPPGPHILSDMVMTSSVMLQGGGNGRNNASAVSSSVDTAMEDELQMALRMSIEEQKQQEQAVIEASRQDMMSDDDEDDDDDEDALLAQAIAMSMAMNQPTTTPQTPAVTTNNDAPPPVVQQQQQPSVSEALEDPEFINSLLDGIEGVSAEDFSDIWDQVNDDDKDKNKE